MTHKIKTTFSRLLFVMCRQNVDNENDYDWLHAGGVCYTKAEL